MTEVYAVAEYDRHYPLVDNVVRVFSSYEKAKSYADSYTSDYDYVEIFIYEVE